MIDIENITLKQYMGFHGMKAKDFSNRTTLSNIFNWGKNIWKFNKNYVGDKNYFPSNKSVWLIADVLKLTIEQTKTLIKNELKTHEKN